MQTTYEEIPILWDQELNFRPNFTIEGDVVILPTIFAKVSGVKDGDVAAYWAFIKQLVTPDTLFIERVPFIRREDDNPIKPCATHFWRNNRLQGTAIKRIRYTSTASYESRYRIIFWIIWSSLLSANWSEVLSRPGQSILFSPRFSISKKKYCSF